MNFYRILLRLGGSMLNEVRKERVSAPEVMLLNAIHGGDAVVEIAPALVQPVEDDFSPKQHRRLRARLEETYGVKQAHVEIINGLFGAAKAGLLPTEVELADLQPDMEEEVDLDDDVTDLPKPTAAAQPTDPKEAIKNSLRELGVPVPKGNVSEERLRKELLKAQEAINESDSEPADVLAAG